MHHEERPPVVARYWWQFTLREVFYFVALLSGYLAFISYVGNYIAIGVCGFAFVTLALASQRSRVRRVQELYLLARCFLVGHFASIGVLFMIGEARNAWGVNAPRFWTFLAATIVVIFWIVSTVVAAMRPLVEIRNDSGETLNQLSACLYLDDRLIGKFNGPRCGATLPAPFGQQSFLGF